MCKHYRQTSQVYAIDAAKLEVLIIKSEKNLVFANGFRPIAQNWPRLSVEEMNALVAASYEKVIPEDGEARGRMAACLAMAEVRGLTLLLRKLVSKCP